MAQVTDIKQRTTENLKALAYDILKTLEYYRNALSAVEQELKSREGQEEKPSES